MHPYIIKLQLPQRNPLSPKSIKDFLRNAAVSDNCKSVRVRPRERGKQRSCWGEG